jgi:DMSO/TMAO reductase YedYZ molybdopterin-dependent catalytic subunit
MGLMFLFFVSYINPGISALVDEVEVREYEGIDLSSIYDFRENSILGPQYVEVEDYTLRVEGLVENVLELSYDDVVGVFDNYQKVVTLHCVEGWSVTILWEGFLLEDLLNEAKVDQRASVVIFHAYDGYSTSLPLDYLIDKKIIVAHKMNNLTLPPERGFPFQLVSESKYGYKWIKWITKIELSNNTDYRGYWEARGYSNDAEISAINPSPIPGLTSPLMPTSLPTPDPISTPTPSFYPEIEPTNTPNASPSIIASVETGLPLKYVAVGIAAIAGIVLLVLLIRRK